MFRLVGVAKMKLQDIGESEMSKSLGIFDAGIRNVELFVRPGVDAEFSLQPREGKQAKITIGIEEKWWGVVANLTHEIVELQFTDMGLRYMPAPDVARDNGAYLFSMNHTQFSEATARAGLFLSKALPVLEKYYKKVS